MQNLKSIRHMSFSYLDCFGNLLNTITERSLSKKSIVLIFIVRNRLDVLSKPKAPLWFPSHSCIDMILPKENSTLPTILSIYKA